MSDKLVDGEVYVVISRKARDKILLGFSGKSRPWYELSNELGKASLTITAPIDAAKANSKTGGHFKIHCLASFMSKIENINVGDYLTRTGDDYCSEKFIPNGFECQHVPEIRRFDPEPLKVVAIATPYVLCERIGSQKGSVSIDCRYTRWTKVEELFVREFCRLEQVEIPEDAKNEEEIDSDKESKKRLCPLCVEPMLERKNIGDETGWLLTCKQCKMQYVPIGRKYA